MVIAKDANLGKFTCLSHQQEVYHIPEDDACSQGTSIQENPKIQTTCKCSGSHDVTCVHTDSPVQVRQSLCVDSMNNSNITPHVTYNNPSVAHVQSRTGQVYDDNSDGYCVSTIIDWPRQKEQMYRRTSYVI